MTAALAVAAGVCQFVAGDGSGVVVFSPASGGVHRLSGPAAVVWLSVDGVSSAADIAAACAAVSGAALSVVEADVRVVLAEMSALRLLVPAASGRAG